jgi:FtsH-binding integral membrane protein
MSFNPFNSSTSVASGAAVDQGLRAHMLRVYNYMGLGVALTGLMAWLVATTPALNQLFYVTGADGRMAPSVLGLVAMFAPLGFIFFFSFAAMRSSLSLLQGMFWAFCAVMGVSMSSIFIVFTGESIARTFFVVAGMFFATSLYGYTTKRDLATMGSFMVMGLIGILLAGIVNLFLQSSGLQFAISVLGVLIFTGLTAWDTQRIKETYNDGHGSEGNNKLALFGALSLYLNFVNLFQFMLQFMGGRRE